MLNPIAMTLAEVTVGPEASFERLSVIPLTPNNPKLPMDCISLDEALIRGDFEVTELSEAGQVPELQVVNDSDTRVLLMDGEELVGAKQNRIVNLTILVPARATVVIPVSCVANIRARMTSIAIDSGVLTTPVPVQVGQLS